MKKGIMVLIQLNIPIFCGWSHGFIKFITTPFSPSIELLWLLPISLCLFVIINIILLVFLLKKKTFRSIIRIFLFILISLIIMGILSYIIMILTNSLIPTIYLPNPTFWGLPWYEDILPFSFWNILILSILIFVLYFILKLKKSKYKSNILVINVVLYIICLLPIIILGAFSHGHEGGYITDACSRQIRRLNDSFIRYAIESNNYFPEGNSIDEIIEKILSYGDKTTDKFVLDSLYCPLESAYTKMPRKYIWNINYSGKRITDFSLIYNIPFQCPYHQNHDNFEYFSEDIINLLKNLKNNEKN